MPIAPGTRLGPYEIATALGAGGMGEVYRARDTRLSRDVAIKVLPSEVAADPARMARFEREAQMLAALNHSHIATIHGLEDWNGTRALVMELVEGPTLAERIAGRALPLDEVVPIARQIAEALEYAHERGIIHRDLKPANIKVTGDGQVRILDFGLAKALADESGAQDISSSPTLSMAATKAGLILGTAAYMAPEQARGKSVDRRADIWAFGCVLYEMLTGRAAFHGDNVSDILASVLKTEPDWTLPAGTPPAAARLVRRCLEKDAKRRLQAIGEARIALEDGLDEATEEPSRAATAPAKRGTPDKAAWGIAAVLLIVSGALAWMVLNRSTAAPLVKRSIVALPAGEILPAVANTGVTALSADGTLLVTIASRRTQGTGWQLYLRHMDEAQFRPLEGTDDSFNPTFSPDGKWIAFMSGGKLKKIPSQGGPATVICDANITRGIAWGPDDNIVFSRGAGAGLFIVPATGGEPKPLTLTDSGKNEVNHRWPAYLPGGKSLLFASQKAGSVIDDSDIEVLNLETGQRKLLMRSGSVPQYVASGYLIFGRAGTLHAAPFDVKRLEVTGPALPVIENVWGDGPSGAVHYSIADDGTLVYVEGTTLSRPSRLGLMDSKGVINLVATPSQQYFAPAMSPDGKRVAVTVQANNTDVWVVDLARNATTRLTFQSGEDETSAWTPDGKKIAYSASTDKGRTLLWKNADGSGGEEVLWAGGTHHHVSSFSPDGRFLMYVDYDNSTKGDIFYLPVLEKDRQPQQFIHTPFNERSAMFSPDGKWVAYASDESGRDEVYVQPFPGPGGKWQVSTEGGYGPVWSHNGRELFFRLHSKLMVAQVGQGATFSVSAPRPVLEAPFEAVPRREANYDIAPDGRHFIVIQVPESSESMTQMHLVTNWAEEVKRKVPKK